MHLPDEVECGLAEAVTPGRQEEALLAKATIIRWEINGKVVAYSYPWYRLARHTNRTESGFTKGRLGVASFIDDKGDGILRALVPDTLKLELIPAWAKPPTT
jgi:hypothetical protein